MAKDQEAWNSAIKSVERNSFDPATSCRDWNDKQRSRAGRSTWPLTTRKEQTASRAVGCFFFNKSPNFQAERESGSSSGQALQTLVRVCNKSHARFARLRGACLFMRL